MTELWVLEAFGEPGSDETTGCGWLANLLAVQIFGSLFSSFCLRELISLLLELCMKFLHLLILFLVINKLPQKEIPVIFLTGKLNLELLIFLLQKLIVIIDFLRNLSHRFQMLVKLLFLLLEVILVVFFLLGLSSQLLFGVLNS